MAPIVKDNIAKSQLSLYIIAENHSTIIFFWAIPPATGQNLGWSCYETPILGVKKS
jgi:hypothetical protein